MKNIPSEVTLFRMVNIFDGKNERLLIGHDVLVVENKIKKIGKDIKIADTYEIGSFRNLRGSPGIRVIREAACTGRGWAWAACSAAG